jgi:glycosyltransferase involved in cell wall biosynthesis
MRYHIIGLHHTVCDDRYSACAFTGKIRRLPAVLRIADPGAQTFLYSVGAPVHAREAIPVQVRTEAQLRKRFGKRPEHDYAKNCADQDSIRDFELALIPKLRKRVEVGDFILHPFGSIHSNLVAAFPEAIHVESGIGYMSGPFGAYRVFETEAWRHWHFGRFHDTGPMRHAYSGGPNAYNNTFVCPNYYDPEDWPLGDGAGDYVVFAGRLEPYKGLGIVAEVARRMPGTQFKIAGSGSSGFIFDGMPNVEMLGVVNGKDRAALYGGARCMIMPTTYCEPFGGSAVEAMLCGTPVVSSDFGAFTETVAPTEYGATCRTVDEFAAACMGFANHLTPTERGEIRYQAVDRYGYQAVAAQYRYAFEALRTRP